MSVSDIKVLLVDGYIDDPAALGVPPYISPMVRSVAGAAADAGATVEYVTVDRIRKGYRLPKADVSVVLSGNTVPGRYLRSMPMSANEIRDIVPRLSGWKLIGGSSASTDAADGFNFQIMTDLAASLYDGMTGKEVNERLRTLDEWNRWMVLGADIVKMHQDHPQPLIAEVETYRGCHRYANGGCSYCIEPLKGKPLMRAPADILEEVSRLKELGVRNIRIGGQTCIVSYGSEDYLGIPKPEPDTVNELFTSLREMNFDVLHVDNANPAVIAEHPDGSAEILRTLAECCTSGNVLALGMESADENVIKMNNLNATPGQVMRAVRMINDIGSERGGNGMPKLLPGLNLISGLDGETPGTYAKNAEFLRTLFGEGLMVRRINIRQVLPVRREFETKVDHNRFKKYKQGIRENIDSPMLKRIVPVGTVLRNVYLELIDGGLTFGRQIGTYPLLIGIPYRTDIDRFCDIVVTDHGFRSITGIEYPFPINTAGMAAISSLPGIGKKRAAKIILARPIPDMEGLAAAVGDAAAAERLAGIVTFGAV
ncbi:MAG: radical SAM protein [Methanomassiliicoccaceae archaeon]|jgi:radical SAM superfamily enzyme with C-terminal helix-hairpin-helix motif|nr:radical SAM protein [Methanomassiliicoccaceae archaeon]